METNERQKTRVIPSCSFCGKRQDQVRELIEGPGKVFICNECIDVCRQVIDEELSLERLREGPTGVKQEHICSSCGTICPVNYHYCHNCGSPLHSEPLKKDETE